TILNETGEELARMPAVLDALLRGLGEDTWYQRPIEGEWSVIEILCHMCDEEAEDFRERLRLILEGGAELASISPEEWPDLRCYRQQDPNRTLSRFKEERAKSLAWLASLDTQSERLLGSARRPGADGARLSGLDLLAGWVSHDQLHLAQLAGTLARVHATQWAPANPMEYGGPIPYPAMSKATIDLDESPVGAVIREVKADSDLEVVVSFLEPHVETSLFLLSNLMALGPRLGDHRNSGNYKVVLAGDKVQAAFCLTRRGNLLVQTGGRPEFAEQILDACRSEPIAINGVLGEWESADAIWRLLCADSRFRPVTAHKEVLYRRDLTLTLPADEGAPARSLTAEAAPQWLALETAFLTAQGVPIQGTDEQRMAGFAALADAGQWWGAFDGEHLISMACLSAIYRHAGQVGGVFTKPEHRRQGLSKSVVTRLIRDSVARHRLQSLSLFTGEGNFAAQALYEGLGFQRIGYHALLFGEWGRDRDPPVSTST
ncbi:MAG: hypothetical protein QOF51_3298, partial [Chloroflexota bacterium]|nr:hypothetical protein [Chloroflexota bacterium]